MTSIVEQKCISFLARLVFCSVFSVVFCGCVHSPQMAAYRVPFNSSGDFHLQGLAFCFYMDYYSWHIECYEDSDYENEMENDLLRPERWHGIQEADYFYHYSNKTNMMDRTVAISVRDHDLELRMRFSDVVIENYKVQTGTIDLSIYATPNTATDNNGYQRTGH